MSGRPGRTSGIAWILCGLVCVLALVDLGLTLQRLPANTNVIKLASVVAWKILPIVFSVVGALITSRQPRNPIGWLLMAPALLIVLTAPMEAYLGRFTTAPPPTFPNLLMTWFQSWAWMLLIFPLFLILLLFPNGRPPSPRWRWVLVYAGGMIVFFLLFATFLQNLYQINDPIAPWTLPNPIGFIPDDLITVITAFWGVNLVALVLICVTALFVRYRRAQDVERFQIRWLLFASGIFVLVYLPGGMLSDLQGLVKDVGDLLFSISIMLLPIAIATAILRYRLYDIDVIIRKTVVYTMVVGLLALVYLGGVLLLQRLFARLGAGESPVAIVLSTLLIAAIFNPLRRRVQEAVDRRFYRKKYDAEGVLAAFAAQARDEVDIERLSAALVGAVEETVQPENVSLWLKGSRLGHSEHQGYGGVFGD